MTTVLYHGGGCRDGFTAAWLMRWKYPAATFVPVNYGQLVPETPSGDTVYVVDFCYHREELVALCRRSNKVVVLDHHKSHEQDVAGLEEPGLTIVFDMGKSGARLAWEWINRDGANGDPSLSSPWIVDYTEDRDLWRWSLPDSKEINAALRSHPMTFDLWDSLAKLNPALLVPEGRAILRRESQIVDEHVRHAVPVELDGHKGLAVNATTMISEVAGKLAESAEFGATWFRRHTARTSGRSAVGARTVSTCRCWPSGGAAAATTTLPGGNTRQREWNNK